MNIANESLNQISALTDNFDYFFLTKFAEKGYFCLKKPQKMTLIIKQFIFELVMELNFSILLKNWFKFAKKLQFCCKTEIKTSSYNIAHSN